MPVSEASLPFSEASMTPLTTISQQHKQSTHVPFCSTDQQTGGRFYPVHLAPFVFSAQNLLVALLRCS